MTQEKTRIYTKVSAKAVRGFKRMSATKDILVEPTGNGEFTVIITDKVNVTEADRECAALTLAAYTLGTLALILAPAMIEGRSPERGANAAWPVEVSGENK